MQIDESHEIKTLEMLIGAAPTYEQHHKEVCIPVFIFICAVSFAAKYIEKAFDLIDDGASVVEVFLGYGKGFESYWHKKICAWFKVSALKRHNFQLASRFNTGKRKKQRIIDMVRSARSRIPIARNPQLSPGNENTLP